MGSSRLRALLAASFAAFLVLVPPALAVEPDEVLVDARLEARARELSAELRCLVCQNQSIDDSNAPLARDLRLLVRERLKAGDTDRQVLDFIVARYGEFVLLRPPFGTDTLLLWLTPLAALAGAGLILWSAARKRRERLRGSADVALTDTEEAELRSILERPHDPHAPTRSPTSRRSVTES